MLRDARIIDARSPLHAGPERPTHRAWPDAAIHGPIRELPPADGAEPVTESYPLVLSTQFTFFFKFVFPVLVLGVLSRTLILVARGNPRVAVAWLIPIGLIVALFWFYAWPIKRVLAYQDHLVVSNYLREVPVPYDQITSVDEVRWINWRPVVVKLKTPTAFGDSFIFYPAVDSIFGGFSEERSATRFLRQHLGRS